MVSIGTYYRKRTHFLGQDVWVVRKPFRIRIRRWVLGPRCDMLECSHVQAEAFHGLGSRMAKQRGALLRSTDPEEPFVGGTGY